jgi:hypothetical protein
MRIPDFIENNIGLIPPPIAAGSSGRGARRNFLPVVVMPVMPVVVVMPVIPVVMMPMMPVMPVMVMATVHCRRRGAGVRKAAKTKNGGQ